MLRRVLTAAVTAAGAVVVGLPGVAGAEPPAPPPPPPPPPFDVNALTPISPAGFAVLDGSWYVFGAPGDLRCVLDRRSGQYGCRGPLPGAPGGANVVRGNQTGLPEFVFEAAPPVDIAGPAVPLPAGSRVGFRNVSCGTDGVTTSCLNSFDESGFVAGPGGSYIIGADGPPLLYRPEGTNPYIN